MKLQNLNEYLISLETFTLEFARYRDTLAAIPNYDLSDPEVMSMIMHSCIGDNESPIFKEGNTYVQKRILFSKVGIKKIQEVIKGTETSHFGCVSSSLESLSFNKILIDDLEDLEDREEADYLVSLDSNLDIFYEEFDLEDEDVEDYLAHLKEQTQKDSPKLDRKISHTDSAHSKLSSQSHLTENSGFSFSSSRRSVKNLVFDLHYNLSADEARLKLLSFLHLILIHFKTRRLSITNRKAIIQTLVLTSKVSDKKLKYKIHSNLIQMVQSSKQTDTLLLNFVLSKIA